MMKSISRKDHKRLKEVLADAHLEKEKMEIEEHWRERVMIHIRSKVPRPSKADYFEALGRFVWKWSPVACALVLLMAGAAIQFDFLPEYEIAKILMEEPIDMSLLEIF